MHATEWIEQHGKFLRRVDAATIRRVTGRSPGECTWCGSSVPKGRQTFCSRKCVKDFEGRMMPSCIRHAVFQRDRGVCAHCGLDTAVLKERVMRSWERSKHKNLYYSWKRIKLLARRYRCGPRESPWEADHIVPVAEGGGCCTIENYRTLCWACHKKETKALKRRLAERARDEKRPLLNS